MYFRNYRLSNTWLDHSLKSAVSEYPSTVNMLKGPKHLWNLHDSTFINIFTTLRRNDLENISLIELRNHMEYFLRHWLPITSIMFRNVKICCFLFKCNYLNNRKLFCQFLFRFKESEFYLKHFPKRKFVIANVFPKYQTIKNLFRQLSKNCRFRTSFDGQHVKGFQLLLKLAWEHFYHIFPSLGGKIIWKIPPLLKFEIIGMFVNTMTLDYKSPVLDCEDLPFPIQMQLS